MKSKSKAKPEAYMGFAKRAGRLSAGTSATTFDMQRGAVQLLVLAEDVSENTKKKVINTAKATGTEYRVYGKGEELSHLLGSPGRYVFGIKDKELAKVVAERIDEMSDEGGVNDSESK